MWWTLLLACSEVVAPPAPVVDAPPAVPVDHVEPTVLTAGDFNPVALAVGPDALWVTTLDGELRKVPRTGGEAVLVASQGNRAGDVVIDGDDVVWMEVGSYQNERGIRAYRIWRLGEGEPKMLHEGTNHGGVLFTHHGDLVWTEQGGLDGEFQSERNAKIWTRFHGDIAAVDEGRWQIGAATAHGFWIWFYERWTSPTEASGFWLRRMPLTGGAASKERDLRDPVAIAADDTYVWWLDQGLTGMELWRQEAAISWDPTEPERVAVVEGTAAGTLAVGAGHACWGSRMAPSKVLCWSDGVVRERAELGAFLRDLVIVDGTLYAAVSAGALAGDYVSGDAMRLEAARGSVVSFPLTPSAPAAP